MLLHLGDVGTVEVIDALLVPAPQTPVRSQPVASAQAPDPLATIEAHLVFGNTDWDHLALERYATGLGIRVDHPTGTIPLEDGELVFCHGHEPQPMQQALARRARYLCHGHTHRASDTRHGPTRVINPGALFRARPYTVAWLDTSSDELQFLTVNDQG